MSNEAFEALCVLEETLRALGMASVLEALAEGDDEAVEATLEALIAEEEVS